MTVFILCSCFVLFVYLGLRARAAYLAEDQYVGPELDEVGELLGLPRAWRGYEPDSRYRRRLRVHMYAIAYERDTVGR
jgi:hypothetical protein